MHACRPLAFLATLVACCALCLPAHAQGLEERVLTMLPLKGPLQDPNAEISSATWHEGHLLLMPQYPDWKNDERMHPAALFAIPEQDLAQALEAGTPAPLLAREIIIQGLKACSALPGYEGFEAIATVGDTVFLSIEARHRQTMRSHLIKGRFKDFETRDARLELDCQNPRLVETPVNLRNMSFESLLVTDQALFLFYEANGRNVNPTPKVLRFDHDLKPTGELPFPHLEYRLTDVSRLEPSAEDDNRFFFWGINYFWPGERQLLNPAEDPIAAGWGRGATHSTSEAVERLLLFELTEEGVQLSPRPPLSLSLGLLPRNWEGLALLRTPKHYGLLLVTDKYPATMLAFVPLP